MALAIARGEARIRLSSAPDRRSDDPWAGEIDSADGGPGRWRLQRPKSSGSGAISVAGTAAPAREPPWTWQRAPSPCDQRDREPDENEQREGPDRECRDLDRV